MVFNGSERFSSTAVMLIQEPKLDPMYRVSFMRNRRVSKYHSTNYFLFTKGRIVTTQKRK